MNDISSISSSARAQETAVNVSRSQTSDITIVTAEGDKVTLSSNFVSELSYVSYDAKGRLGDSTSAAAAEFHSSRDVSVTVEGDLSREELKDIRRAVKTIMKATQDVLSGDPDKAADRAEKLQNLDQIASIDATMTVTREVSVAKASSVSPTDVQEAEHKSTESSALPSPEPPPSLPSTDNASPSLVLPPINILRHLLFGFAVTPKVEEGLAP